MAKNNIKYLQLSGSAKKVKLVKEKGKILKIDVDKAKPGSDYCAILNNQNEETKKPKPNNADKLVKKRNRKRAAVPSKDQMLFPKQVPTRFSFNVNKHLDIRDQDYVCNYLSIRTNELMCCVCFQNYSKDQMQPILAQEDCNDFGRIFSIVLNLSESEIISPYCCSACSDRVLDCFNALLELNLAVCCAVRKYDSKRDKKDDSPYMCSLCPTKVSSSPQLMDHVMLHAVEPLLTQELHPVQKTNSKQPSVEVAVSENIEEGELVPLAVSNNPIPAPSTPAHVTSLKLNDEHCYSVKKDKKPNILVNHDEESRLCPICGEMKGRGKFLTRHINRHMRGGQIATRAGRCHLCKIFCIDRLTMHRHLKEVHNFDDKLPKKLKKCRLCDLKFGSLRNRERHEQNDHIVEGFFLCPFCPRKFQFYEGIIGHCRKKHPYQLSKESTFPKEKKKRVRKPKIKIEKMVFSSDYHSPPEELLQNNYDEDEKSRVSENIKQETYSSISDKYINEVELETGNIAAQYIVDFIEGDFYEELVST